jgi:hypoxanthine phosphoribosyltransferase
MHSKYPTLEQLSTFDYIVAISRGGLVPAFLIARLTNIRRIDTIICQSYTDKRDKHSISYTPKDLSHLEGQKVLIVDELVETGETLEFVVNTIASANPSEIKTFVVFRKDITKFEPDYFLEDKSKEWIYFRYDEVELENIIGYIAK